VSALDVEDGWAKFEASRPDIVIVDLLLPGESGLEILRRVKAVSSTPVVLISAAASEAVKLEAMGLGADDFLAKPFIPGRLSETLAFLLAKQRGGVAGAVLRSGDVQIDLARKRVLLGERTLELSQSEWRLIDQLAKTPGQPRLNEELLTAVWGRDYHADLAYLRVWIDRLRTKIGDDVRAPHVILGYLDVGFTLNATPSAATVNNV
jgi:DNA-binding response OmpR family regulator